jgi:hypothetical protein
VWPFLEGGCALLSEGVQQGAYPKGEAVMTNLSILKLSFFAAVLALASTPSTLHAQAQIKVPFAFEVGSAHFAPGVYTLSMLNGSTLHVRGIKYGAYASIQSGDNSQTITGGKVVFHRIGAQYFLSEVWSSETKEPRIVYPSKAEKQALRQLAANPPAAQGVEAILAQATK